MDVSRHSNSRRRGHESDTDSSTLITPEAISRGRNTERNPTHNMYLLPPQDINLPESTNIPRAVNLTEGSRAARMANTVLRGVGLRGL